MIQEWRKITIDNGDFDRYSVSNDGQVRSDETERPGILKLSANKHGYLKVQLYTRNGLDKTFYVHKLVTHEFIGPRPKGMEVNHMDGNKPNNGIFNLEYVTHFENMKHKHERGLGDGNYLSDKEAMQIFDLYYNKGMMQKDIGNKLGVSNGTISSIINGKSRSYLKKQWEAT